MSVALHGNLKDFGIAEVFQLIGQALWQMVNRALHGNHIIGPMSRGTFGQGGVMNNHIIRAILRQDCQGLIRNLGIFLNRNHRFCHACHHGGRIAVSTANIEDQLIALNIQRFKHFGQCTRFQHHAPVAQIEVFIRIGGLT